MIVAVNEKLTRNLAVVFSIFLINSIELYFYLTVD